MYLCNTKINFIMKTIKITLLVVGLFLQNFTLMQAAERWLEGYKKVLVIGAHPDDPETIDRKHV